MSALWTAEEAAKATGGKASGAWRAQGVSIDSRSLKPGELFVALSGERVDGHRYVADALKRGASAAMVSAPVEGVPQEKLLVVPEPLKALESLGRHGRARAQARIVALTGSVGKTSTKEMLRRALAAHGDTFATHGNFNNHIGTPLNLANLLQSTQLAVFELGMNHAGEIAALTRQVRPHVALITAVEAVHLEFFDTVDAIADAKSEIFEGVEPGGAAVLNRDSAHYERCHAHARRYGIENIISFGRSDAADCRLLAYTASLAGSEVRAAIAGREVRYTLSTVGIHWALTSVAVLAVAHALGLNIETTAAALAGFSELPGRGSLHRISVLGGEALLVDDSYNASPAAMRAAFAKLAELRQARAGTGRVIAALGDMRELGAMAPQLHAALAAETQGSIDLVFTAGPLMRHLHDALPAAMRGAHAPDADALIPVLASALSSGDLVLVKGSHGSHMYRVAAALLKPTQEKRHAV